MLLLCNACLEHVKQQTVVRLPETPNCLVPHESLRVSLPRAEEPKRTVPKPRGSVTELRMASAGGKNKRLSPVQS